MISLLKLFLRIFPWLLVVALLGWMLLAEKFGFDVVEGGKETYQNTLLTRVEQMGKLELVKYNFQEVTEIRKLADYVDFKIYKLKLAQDAKAVLISRGSAVGCIDLSQVREQNINLINDTLYVLLPQPELCYFKIDLENSRIYDLEISSVPRNEQKDFMEELYRVAEAEIRRSAMEMGIMEQTKENAHLILKPLFENISGKPVVLTFEMERSLLDPK